MRNKKIKAIRKQLNVKLPVEADLRHRDVKSKSGRKPIVNVAKYQYRQLKKILLKG